MIDLYTALKLCNTDDHFSLNGFIYTREEMVKTLDLRKIKVKQIMYDFFHGVMYFKTK